MLEGGLRVPVLLLFEDKFEAFAICVNLLTKQDDTFGVGTGKIEGRAALAFLMLRHLAAQQNSAPSVSGLDF